MNTKYPEHEFSHFIDNGFSFNGIVYPSKEKLVDMTKNARCAGESIMLEPRLQEYLKKKKYYKDNNIGPCISLEKEFLIGDRDRRVLRAFFKGNNMYGEQGVAVKHFKEDNNNKKKQYFPSKEFRNDPRVPKISTNNKQTQVPVNRGMFAPDKGNLHYEDEDFAMCDDKNLMMDARDLNSTISGFDIDGTRFDPRNDPRIYPGKEKYNKYTSQYRIDPYPNNELKKRRKKREQKMPDNVGAPVNLSGNSNMKPYRLFDGEPLKGGRYGAFDEPTFSEKSDMDTMYKTVTPKLSSNSKREQSTYDYTMGGNISNKKQVRDSEFESSLLRGMPSNTRKSYGYRQPDEQYFQYIDPDFNDEEHVVEPWIRGGESTRRNNKALAKQKYRDIM